MIITITGPSGSGKTTISKYLEQLDKRFMHINVDKIGHNSLENIKVMQELQEKLNIKSKITRKEIGEIVFNNREKMKILSDITWNIMEEEIDSIIKENKQRIIILDWILIPKTKYFKESNFNILLTSNLETRTKRAIERDKITEEKFLEREKATVDYTPYNFDLVIDNSELTETKRLVKKIYDSRIISRKF